MREWHPITIFFWFLFWPISHLAGSPPEINEPITWQKAVRLAGLAIMISVCLTISVLIADKFGWIN